MRPKLSFFVRVAGSSRVVGAGARYRTRKTFLLTNEVTDEVFWPGKVYTATAMGWEGDKFVVVVK